MHGNTDPSAALTRTSSELPELPDLSDPTGQLEQSLFIARSVVDIVSEDASHVECKPSMSGECPWTDAFFEWEGPVWKIVDWEPTERAYEHRAARATPTESKRLTVLMELLRSRGDHRKLAAIPSNWRQQLDTLAAQFPNFGAVITYIRGAYALAEYGNSIASLSPILLNGPPGVGKTLFATAFAEHFGSGLVTVRMETAQTASALVGSSEYWGNTKSGEVCNALLEKDFANPVVFLDEIDKAVDNEHDPLMALYSLLEPSTAQQFTDLSYPWLTLDASHIVWLCTSNDTGPLPAPILDRLRRFDIPQPTEPQTRQMVKAIFEGLLIQLPGVASSIHLTPKAIDVLASLSPRQIRQALTEAIGHVLYEGRQRLLPRDIPIRPDDTNERPRVGFLP